MRAHRNEPKMRKKAEMKCSYCGDEFDGRVALKSHMLTAHGTEKSVTRERQLKFECPSCDRRFVFVMFKKYIF